MSDSVKSNAPPISNPIPSLLNPPFSQTFIPTLPATIMHGGDQDSNNYNYMYLANQHQYPQSILQHPTMQSLYSFQQPMAPHLSMRYPNRNLRPKRTVTVLPEKIVGSDVRISISFRVNGTTYHRDFPGTFQLSDRKIVQRWAREWRVQCLQGIQQREITETDDVTQVFSRRRRISSIYSVDRVEAFEWFNKTHDTIRRNQANGHIKSKSKSKAKANKDTKRKRPPENDDSSTAFSTAPSSTFPSSSSSSTSSSSSLSMTSETETSNQDKSNKARKKQKKSTNQKVIQKMVMMQTDAEQKKLMQMQHLAQSMNNTYQPNAGVYQQQQQQQQQQFYQQQQQLQHIQQQQILQQQQQQLQQQYGMHPQLSRMHTMSNIQLENEIKIESYALQQHAKAHEQLTMLQMQRIRLLEHRRVNAVELQQQEQQQLQQLAMQAKIKHMQENHQQAPPQQAMQILAAAAIDNTNDETTEGSVSPEELPNFLKLVEMAKNVGGIANDNVRQTSTDVKYHT